MLVSAMICAPRSMPDISEGDSVSPACAKMTLSALARPSPPSALTMAARRGKPPRRCPSGPGLIAHQIDVIDQEKGYARAVSAAASSDERLCRDGNERGSCKTANCGHGYPFGKVARVLSTQAWRAAIASTLCPGIGVMNEALPVSTERAAAAAEEDLPRRRRLRRGFRACLGDCRAAGCRPDSGRALLKPQSRPVAPTAAAPCLKRSRLLPDTGRARRSGAGRRCRRAVVPQATRRGCGRIGVLLVNLGTPDGTDYGRCAAISRSSCPTAG